ncbi:MAG: tryptophan synthase subunit alpha [Nitrospirota bacterium]
MISRIEETFRELKKKGKKAFIPYIMAGDPSLEMTKDIVLMFGECVADIVELGVPFTDPLADGPTIQRASERALERGVTLRRVMAFVKDLRESTQIPITLMTYYNPVFKYGEENFVRDAKDAGVDGVIIPDLPPDEAESFVRPSRKASLDTIFLLAPTSTPDRIKKVAKASRGFIYYVSITGITGSRLLLDGSIEALISEIREYTDKPIAVGFGVSTPEEASAVSKVSDGVIVGSGIVKRLNEPPDELKRYIISLREAIK